MQSGGAENLDAILANAAFLVEFEATLGGVCARPISASHDAAGQAAQALGGSRLNLITPYARIIDLPDQASGIALLRKIEWAGRISHRSEEAQSDTSWEKFIQSVVVGHGDWSIVEHASVTVDFYVDRGVTHELVRHRLFAFTQESTRFVNSREEDAGQLRRAG